MSKKLLGIVLVNYGGIGDTLECLESIEAMTGTNVKTVVVNVSDNKNGRVEEGDRIKNKFGKIVLIQSSNIGFSGANNLGIKYLLNINSQNVMLLNNDTKVDRKLASTMVTTTLREKVGAVSPKIYFYPGKEFHKSDYRKEEYGRVIWFAGGLLDKKDFYAWHRGVDELDHGQFDQRIETDFVTGCCLVAKKEIWEKVGLLAEKAFLYFEDVDWSLRVLKAGFDLIYDPNGIVWHKNAGSTAGSGSDTHIYYQTRNRFYYGMKHSGLRPKLTLLREAVRKLGGGNGIEKEASKDALFLKMGKRYG